VSVYHKNALPRAHEIAEYTIKSVLGHGGFGITYLAEDTSLGSLVAIKEYLPHSLAVRTGGQTQIVPNPEASNALRDYQWGLKRFLQEARALARFKHPNIVRVLRYMESNGTAYMVMEYEKGQALSQYLKENKDQLTEKKLLNIYLPILTGLEAVHQAGLLHLDIKPGNIYLRQDGSPMLIDFGSVRQAMTGHGMDKKIVLTPGYAPIEQYPDKGVPGPWTDVYALGASMYRCIRGKRPTNSLERYQMILKTQTDPVTPAKVVGKGQYQKFILECIDWALQAYPSDRPKTAKELQNALLGIGQAKSSEPMLPSRTKSGTGTPKKRVRRRNLLAGLFRLLMIVIVSAGLASAAAAYYWPTLTKKWPQLQTALDKSGVKKIPLSEYINKLKKQFNNIVNSK